MRNRSSNTASSPSTGMHPSFTCPPASLHLTRIRQGHDRRYQFPSRPRRRPRTAACLHRSRLTHDIRPDASEATFIPQTVEYSLRQAQAATAHALSSGMTHVRVELPMGRSRKHWYRMSPLDAWYSETSVLVFHFCEMFKGLRIKVVLGAGPGVIHAVPWMEDPCRAADVSTHDFGNGEDRVVVIAGVSQRQQHVISEVMSRASGAEGYIMFNCLLDTPLSHQIPPFQTAYVCRALEKCAVLKEAYDKHWAVFVEIAVFEYEWVGAQEETPAQRSAEIFALRRGARRKGINGYYETNFAGCEAGFWPFMTSCCREVLPMDGRLMAKMEREKINRKARGASRPFGFF